MALVFRLALCALVFLAVAAPASAGPPGSWTQVTQPADEGSSTDRISVARAGNGVLNILWSREKQILNTQVSANARNMSGPHTVFTYGNAAGDAFVLKAPDGGLRAFFAGLYPNDPHDVGLSTATSADGVTWDVQPTLASDDRAGAQSSVYTAIIGGTFFANGTPLSIWSDPNRGYHIGTSDQTPDVEFGTPRVASVFAPNAATDSATGQVAIGWSEEDTSVAFVQPTTNPWFPPGPTMVAPNGKAPDLTDRVDMTGRSGGEAGIFVAYLRGTNVFSGRPAVWRIGANSPIPLSNKAGGRYAGVTAGDSGRLWGFWGERPNARDWQIYARRSNTSATAFGAPVPVKPPAGTASLWGIEGAGDTTKGCDGLDLVAHVTRSDKTANYHQRVVPGITVQTKVLNKRKGKKAKVLFMTFDAGRPIKTTISVGGKRVRTGPDGKVTTKIKRKRRTRKVGAKVRSNCFTKTQVKVKVRKKQRRRR